MWFGIPCNIKYEYSLRYKSVYNCTMPYLIVLMMTSSEVSEDLENN